jgi:hypothetical protein
MVAPAPPHRHPTVAVFRPTVHVAAQAVRLAPDPPSETAARNTDGVDLPATTAAQAATLHLVPAVVEEAPQLSQCRLMALAVAREERPVLALRSETAARNTDGVAQQPTTVVRAATAHSEPAIKRYFFFSALWENRSSIDNYQI